MEKLFLDTDFEPAMCFLVDTLTQCIETKEYGWISKKFGNFSVNFVFMGLKKNVGAIKRNGVEDFCCVPKKVRKLNVSLENLFLNDDQVDMVLEAVSPKSAVEKRQTRSSSNNVSVIQSEVNLNQACSSGNQKIRDEKKRPTNEEDIFIEISDQTQPKKMMKKE